MANLSCVIHCVDGLLIATDTSFPTGQTASYDARQDIIQVSTHRAVVLHGANRAVPQQWFQDPAVRNIVAEGNALQLMMPKMSTELQARFKATGLSAAAPQLLFGILVAGYFEDDTNFFKVNFNAPDFSPTWLPHNVFTGVEDVARLLDSKFPPRSFALDAALAHAAFLILQSCTVYLVELRPSMVAATITKEGGFQWESEERVTEALRTAVQTGRTMDRKLALLFASELGRGANP